jgi:hypothetical protein
MAYSYSFMKPQRLPLVARDLDAASVLPLSADEAVAALNEALPGLRWTSDSEAAAELKEGWAEFRLHDDPAQGTWLSMRCSLRTDYSAAVQDLCDRFQWVAFDEAPRLFQPHRAPEIL